MRNVEFSGHKLLNNLLYTNSMEIQELYYIVRILNRNPLYLRPVYV